ncbi:MAG: hypothetical protein NTY75_03080 [Candidatus Shapirobacteria bacterium]|nr:hypothetical protein [Candidatus Shapirobacteria bacterium]
MIKKRLINIAKISGLIGIRQTYFLGRNWYLLITNPYLTIKSIAESKDKSQIFLISLTALAPAIVYVLARIVTDLIIYGRILWMTGNVFLIAGGIQALVLAYLGYWALQVRLKK